MNDEPAAFESERIAFVRRRTPRALSTLAKLAWAFAGIASWVVGSTDPLLAALALLPFLAVASVVSAYATFGKKGRIETREGHLVLVRGRRQRTVPPRKLAAAFVVDAALAPAVHVELTSGDRWVVLAPDVTAARALVDGLGFGPGGRRMRVDLAEPRPWIHFAFAIFAVLFGMMLGVAIARLHDHLTGGYAGGGFLAAAIPASSLLLYAVFKRFVREPIVSVGDDGVIVEKRIGRRFVTRHELARGFLPDALGEMRVERRRALEDAVQRRFAVAPHLGARSASFARVGDGVATWKAHLAMLVADPTYRTMAVSVADAAAVAASASATFEERVGAALALRIAGEPPARIRVAIEAAVDPALHEAVEAVLREDDAAVDRVLRRRR